MRIEEIKSLYRIEEVIGRSIHLKKRGLNHEGNCPFHNDEHSSLKVHETKQIYKCYACGASGDVLDFFKNQGHSHRETLDIITGNGTFTPAAYVPVHVEPEWVNATPTSYPDLNNLRQPLYGKPSNIWSYRDASGTVIGYTCRFDFPDGKKDVLPYTFKSNGTTSRWLWKGFDTPRPMYNLHLLQARPYADVIMVEGEKAADAATILFSDYICMSWIGGKDNVRYTDFSPLEGRSVYLWADNDVAGVLAMYGGWDNMGGKSKEYKRFKGVSERVNANFKKIMNSKDFPNKWDIADADWSSQQANEYLKNNITDLPHVSETAPGEHPMPIQAPIAPPPAEPAAVSTPKAATPKPDEFSNMYFKILGFNNNGDSNKYVFFVHRSNVIIQLSAGGINTANLMQLAPLNYWEGAYPKGGRNGAKFDINQVANHLIGLSQSKGMFNPSALRGRGAWIDAGRPVIHCGNHLIVDGIETQFSKLDSKHIYAAGLDLGFKLTDKLPTQEANKLLQFTKRLSWGRDINAFLLAGWIVTAPLCGALHWRSHIWITGAAGTGKSWVMTNLVKKMLGNMFVDAQGDTTAAGIRQYLKSDALPVTFDEIESENKSSQERVQAVIEIMRSSSTSDSGKTLKGSAAGEATLYDIRSSFAFASIATMLLQRSDVSRITVMELKPDNTPEKHEKWLKTKEIHALLITPEYIEQFQSRAVWLLPTILKNADTFSAAAAVVLDNQRTGDQVGTLLAGAYSLTSESLISFEDAKKWIQEKDWSEELLTDSTKDEMKVLKRIIDAETVVESNGFRYTRTIGELVIGARNMDVRTHFEAGILNPEICKDNLKRLGIVVIGTDVIISDDSRFIARAFGTSQYAKNYALMLARLPGAEKIDGTIFGSYMPNRATKISSFIIFGEPVKSGLAVAPPVVIRENLIDFN